jgi:hypothetical protein
VVSIAGRGSSDRHDPTDGCTNGNHTTDRCADCNPGSSDIDTTADRNAATDSDAAANSRSDHAAEANGNTVPNERRDRYTGGNGNTEAAEAHRYRSS